MAQMRLIGDADVRAAIDYPGALDLARRTLRDQAAGASLLSAPSAMILDAAAVGGPRAKFKAAAVGHLGASGIRLLSHPSPTEEAYNYCAVYRHADSRLAGLVAERWLSRIRTAAFGVAAVEPLVNPGPLVVALYGAGGIAHEIVPLLGLALRVSELRVHSRRPQSTAAFVAAQSGRVAFPVRAEPDRVRAAEGADLVVTLTEATAPLVAAPMLKPGSVVCSMGSYNELEYGVLQAADRFVVDDADFAAEMGDGAAWIGQGHLTRADFVRRIDARACEVVAGTRSARARPSERIVAIIQGMAIGDIAFAAYALERAERAGRGTLVELP